MRAVEKLASGRYKVRFRYGVSARTGKPKQVSETFDSEAQATQFAVWLDAVGEQAALDLLYEAEQDKAVPTANEVAADHFRYLTGVTDGTRLNYQRLWDRTWGPLIGDVRAHRLGSDHIREAINELSQTYSRKSLGNQRGLLAGVVNRMVEKGWQSRNVVKGIKLPEGQPSRGKEDMRVITPEEYLEIEARMDPHYLPLLRLLWGTGCRWGEAVALPANKVQIPNVLFHQALKWSPDGDRIIGTTKTKKSRRTVELPSQIREELAALKAQRAPTDLLFTAQRGGLISHRNFWTRYWLPAVKHLEPRPRVHDLRHGHASWLLSRGVPIHIVQHRLGHASIQVTVDTYGHFMPDAQRMASEAASLAFLTPSSIGRRDITALPPGDA